MKINYCSGNIVPEYLKGQCDQPETGQLSMADENKTSVFAFEVLPSPQPTQSPF